MFGCAAPDSGNAEILALAGTDEQKSRWLTPLLAGELFSCFAFTEPGADPTMIRTTARHDGQESVLVGDK